MKVKIKVDNDGVKLDYEGFRGKQCDKMEQIILSKLDGIVIERENKPEYYEEEEHESEGLSY